jgi:hypothetical protein
MSKKPENRDEMIKRLTERFRKLLEEKTPEDDLSPVLVPLTV